MNIRLTNINLYKDLIVERTSAYDSEAREVLGGELNVCVEDVYSLSMMNKKYSYDFEKNVKIDINKLPGEIKDKLLDIYNEIEKLL